MPPKKTAETDNLTRILSKATPYNRFGLWIVGDTPLITHAWSQKAKNEMLQKQVGATKGGKEKRRPQEDFINSLYEMGDETYGFPTMGIKKALISAAHKDRGIPKTVVQSALWLDAELVRTRPALDSAICDMPLTKIYGGDPEQPSHPPLCREDMVKIGSGLNKIANLAYRAQFTVWAMQITGKYNSAVLSDDSLGFLINEAGMVAGLGEWRNERSGMFGAFHLANAEESEAWDAFRSGSGPLPLPESYRMAAE